MQIQKRKIGDRIYLLIFKTQAELSSTFMRFQEHYESPKFRGKIFSREEFRKWYIKNNHGKFSYNHDWSGFNIPSTALDIFYSGKFNPLSEREQQFLNLFKKEKGNFYIIAIFKKYKPQIVKHELAHALFFLDKNYKKETLKILKKHNNSKLKKRLASYGDYNNAVMDDEIQACAVSLYNSLKIPFPEKIILEVREIFSKYKTKWKIKI